MRSPNRLEEFHRAFLGDPDDPNYAYRLNAYNLERMAQVYRAMVIGEMLADGLIWLARLPQRLTHALRVMVLRRRVMRAVAGWRAW